jgi:hypothetical protein
MNMVSIIATDQAHQSFHQQRLADIEALARIAARLAGRNPDEHVRMEFREAVAFEGPMWRYHDFIMRAEQAYKSLA